MASSSTFLLIEFLNKDGILTRSRYGIKNWKWRSRKIQIFEKKQPLLFGGRGAKRAFIAIDSHTSENDLFQELRYYISKKYEVSKESIIFRWEKMNSEILAVQNSPTV